MKYVTALATAVLLAACSGEPTPDQDTPASVKTPREAAPQPALDTARKGVDALQMFMLDCGTIEISDLDGFSSAGDYAGQSDVFTDTCWLLRHPEGDFLWDLGLPTGLAGAGVQENGVFSLSMERTLSDQLAEIGLFANDVDMISISHSHFDHSGQADQFQSAKWIVHAAEYAAMFPNVADEAAPEAGEEDTDSNTAAFPDFEALERTEFEGEYDVFADGSVIIFSTPGHTPGHTSLFVNLPDTGPLLLTGDLYHRRMSRALKRVPRFNSDETATLASMEHFEQRAADTGARIIIQHEPDDIADLPKSPVPIK